MLDTVFDFLSDGGSSRTNRTAFAVALILVVTAAVFFTVLYLRYQKVRKESTALADDNLIRRGQLDLRKRCLDADGNVRSDLFATQTQQQKEHPAQQEKEENDKSTPSEREKSKPTMGDQIFETLTSGKLVNMINTFHVRTKGMAKKMQPTISPLERLRAEQHARMADESINPLFKMKTQRPSDNKDDDDDSSSSDDDCSGESVGEFDKEDIVA